jgi:hypothetical protein
MGLDYPTNKTLL